MCAGLFLGLLHNVLALLFEWYWIEVFSKAGIFGAIMIGVVAGGGGSLAVNAMVGRSKPQQFVDWIKEEEPPLP